MNENNELLTSQEKNENNLMISEDDKIHSQKMAMGESFDSLQVKNEEGEDVGEGEVVDEIHHNDGEEINQLQNEGEEIVDHEEYEEQNAQYDEEENYEEYNNNENEENNNGEAEEIQYDEENNGEDYYDEQERDTLEKALTQNIAEDVMQVPEFPIQFYYEKQNFCDYKP